MSGSTPACVFTVGVELDYHGLFFYFVSMMSNMQLPFDKKVTPAVPREIIKNQNNPSLDGEKGTMRLVRRGNQLCFQ